MILKIPQTYEALLPDPMCTTTNTEAFLQLGVQGVSCTQQMLCIGLQTCQAWSPDRHAVLQHICITLQHLYLTSHPCSAEDHGKDRPSACKV